MAVHAGKSIERLSIYRRNLQELAEGGTASVYSHDLADRAGVTAAQVRRDLMQIGYSGSPAHGYDVQKLIQAIGEFLDMPEGQSMALVGIGNLGRAILAYFSGRRPKLRIVAAFDVDPAKVNQSLHGCPCHPNAHLVHVVRELQIQIGLIAVPASEAQAIADLLVLAGIKGLVNFAPVHLRVPAHVHVETVDITTTLEKAAFFAWKGTAGVPDEDLELVVADTETD